MSDSIPKRIRIDPPSQGTNTPTESICSPTGQKMIDSTKEETTEANAIKEEPRCIDDMPEPVLEEILKNLSLRDLKTAVLVSRKWRQEGERSPDLWKWSRVRVHNRDEIKKLSIKRLKHLKYVQVLPGDQWQDADWDAFFEATVSLSRLKVIRGLMGKNLDSVQPEIMADALSKLESVDLSYTQITKDHVEALFKKICQKKDDLTDAAKSVDEEGAPRQKTALKVLDLMGNNLSAVNSELMAKVVSGLEEVVLDGSFLTAPQLQELFSQMNQGTTLKVLYLGHNNLSTVEPRLMAKAVSGLEEVNLYNASLTAPQVQELFSQMDQGTKLKELDLSDNDLSSVDPEVLARAVHRLEEVRLEDTNLTNEQYDRIVSGGDGHSKLEELLVWDPNRNENVDILNEEEDVDDSVDEDVEGEEIDMEV